VVNALELPSRDDLVEIVATWIRAEEARLRQLDSELETLLEADQSHMPTMITVAKCRSRLRAMIRVWEFATREIWRSSR